MGTQVLMNFGSRRNALPRPVRTSPPEKHQGGNTSNIIPAGQNRISVYIDLHNPYLIAQITFYGFQYRCHQPARHTPIRIKINQNGLFRINQVLKTIAHLSFSVSFPKSREPNRQSGNRLLLPTTNSSTKPTGSDRFPTDILRNTSKGILQLLRQQ